MAIGGWQHVAAESLTRYNRCVRALSIILVLFACDSGSDKAKTSTASGSAAGSAAVPPPAPDASSRPACDLDGNYRLRFRSNGADGWWLRYKISGGKAELVARDVMELFPQGPLTFVQDGCTGTISGATEHSGNTKLVFTLAPASNAIAGDLSRARGGEDKNGPQTVPVTGRRDVGAIAAPACMKPGIFEITVGKTRWKLAEGRPRMGNCKDMIEMATARVRIEPLGEHLFVDEVGDKNEQSFARGVVKPISDCELGLALEVQDFSFDGTIKLDGDTITGKAKAARYQVFEDGEDGENLWACKTTNAPLAGKRIAD
jgi:hypothetical protein